MESITTDVFTKDDDIKTLHFIKDDDDVITLKLDDKDICRFSFDGDFEETIKRMLEMWGN